MKPSMLARLIPFAFVVLWSTGFIFSKIAVRDAEPFTFLSVRFALAATILAAVVLLFRAPWPRGLNALHAAVAGALLHGGYLGPVFWTIGQGMSAGVAALIVSTQPILTALIVPRLLGETIAARHWLGLVAGFAGVLLVLYPKFATSGIDARPDTVAAAVLGLLGVTAGSIYQKRFATGLDLRSAGACQFAGATAVIAIAALLLEHGRFDPTPALIGTLAWSVLVLSIGAITLLMLMIREGAISKVTAYFYLVPPVTALMAWAAFGETLLPIQLAGMALTSVGVMIVSRG
jgi:drug/metabolite transporter (DMT)-like permease